MLDATKNVKFTGLTPNVPVASTGESGVNAVSIQPQKPDEFVKQGGEEKKKKLSTGAKVGIGAGFLATAGLIAFLVMKGKVSEAKQLAEHIEFKPAQTLEEAIKFGKEHLGIKSYEDFGANDLDAINWLNEGFVNVSNRMKGKLRMPKQILFTDDQNILGEHSLAGVVSDSNLPQELKKYSGSFFLNKKFFSDPIEAVNNDFKKALKHGYFEKTEDGKIKVNSLFAPETGDMLIDIIEDFQREKSFNSAVRVSVAIENMRNAVNAYTKNPLEVIQSLLKDEKNISMFKEAGINTSLNDIKNLSLKEQIEIRKTMTALLKEQNEVSYVNNLIGSDKQYAEKLVEKGFLDKVETIKEIETNKLVEKGFLDKVEIIKEIETNKLAEIIKYTEEYTGKKEKFYPIELCIDELDKSSPFATVYHEMGHLQDMKPRCLTTAKYNYDYSKYSQELKDWVDNDDNIRIASRVSGYSTSGPGEFIAETFAKLVEGRKVSQEVKDLYRKLGGPELPNM